jgi:RNA recognition motif-containing protein
MNIYVGNLDYKLSEDDLKEVFQNYGEVTSAKIISDKFTGRSKGFGFIEMPNDDDAKNAIEGLNGTDVSGRTMKVNQARERNNDYKNNSNY